MQRKGKLLLFVNNKKNEKLIVFQTIFTTQGHISNQCPQRQGDKGGRKSFGGKPGGGGGGFNKGGFNSNSKFGGGFKKPATTESSGKVTKFED